MFENTTDSTKWALSILFFPLYFQADFFHFAWGADDVLEIALLKRIFLLLPVGAIILGCWASMLCLLSVIIRYERVKFLTGLFTTWWDLGRSIFLFWAGIFQFAYFFTLILFGFLRLTVISIWIFLLDIFLIPFRLMKNLGHNIAAPGVPWISVTMMLFWCTLEAVLFTFVTTPLVVDTLANLMGSELTPAGVRIPLFLFMMVIILGSYAVLSSLSASIASRDFASIFKIGAVELVTMFVEIMFLYREFVDALVPWFAQHAGGDFKMGIFGILAIASATWLGIRSLSWFLFAEHGTPVLMAIIQGTGLKMMRGESPSRPTQLIPTTINTLDQIKKEVAWIHDKGEMLIAYFVLPPIQVIATAINFCVFTLTSKHLFTIPVDNLQKVLDPRHELHNPVGMGFKKGED